MGEIAQTKWNVKTAAKGQAISQEAKSRESLVRAKASPAKEAEGWQVRAKLKSTNTLND